MSPDQLRSLQVALGESDPDFDPEVKMIRDEVSSSGYHTTLKTGSVHPTRNSLAYAVALLDSGEPERLETATQILEKVISLQDRNPDSKTYGIWSWYLEEPLEKMSPPDWNWADFCGVQLLAVWIDHRERLPMDLQEKVRDSILHAARSIQRRNVGLDYSNIAIMGTYVTLVAGERLEDAELARYAKDRLRRLHKYILEQGSFTEYNSPTYTLVAIRELVRMLMHFQDPEDRRLAQEISDLAWKHSAIRFHPPTRQWAGPHSRSYQTDLRERPDYLAILEAATGRQGFLSKEIPLPLGLDHYRLDFRCPPSLAPYYSTRTESREVIETFLQPDPNTDGKRKAVIGTTYLHPKFALGTVNRGMFWNQRRSFLAYWGTAEKPTYLQLRFLHDDYDYCSACVFTAQSEGCALTTVAFAIDYGDTHPNLDKVKDATIRAKDLRLRFEFGAEVETVRIPKSLKDGEDIRVEDREIAILIRPMGDAFGESRFRWESGGNGKQKWIDAVAYQGEERDFDFSKMEEAFLSFALRIVPLREAAAPFDSPTSTREEDWVRSEWNPREGVLHVRVPVRPAPINRIRDRFDSSIEKKERP